MSGLAEILLDHGYRVSGSDLNVLGCERLVRLGARVSSGHHADNIPDDASLLVYSSAVSGDNPEVQEARRRGLPIVRRAEVLAELMRLKFGVGVAGSHGKTTTTSMTAAVMEAGGLDPTVVIGGQVKSLGSGGKLGAGDYLVAETDESDRSFLLLKPTVAVLTNVDGEHLSAYESLSELEASFEQFIASVPFYGLAVLCIDDPKVKAFASHYTGRKITYGLSSEAQLCARDLLHDRGSTSFKVFLAGEFLIEVTLPLPGRHMVQNSLAAIAVGLEFDIAPDVIRGALQEFEGVKRRLELVGEAAGVTVMNDYGHHPAEIRATIKAVRDGWGASIGKLLVVFQPHRYSRTRDCFQEFLSAFEDADSLIVTEIYPASEEPIEGISGESLYSAVKHDNKLFAATLNEAAGLLTEQVEQGDMILCLGAGSIGALPEQLLDLLHGGGEAKAANEA